MTKKSLGGAECFLSFIDDKTTYVWVYPLHSKTKKFCEWKTMVEKFTGKSVKLLYMDVVTLVF